MRKGARLPSRPPDAIRSSIPRSYCGKTTPQLHHRISLSRPSTSSPATRLLNIPAVIILPWALVLLLDPNWSLPQAYPPHSQHGHLPIGRTRHLCRSQRRTFPRITLLRPQISPSVHEDPRGWTLRRWKGRESRSQDGVSQHHEPTRGVSKKLRLSAPQKRNGEIQ